MKVPTAAEMREIDRLASVSYGVPGVVLMENAGMAVARQVREMCRGDLHGRKICVFSGRGNNGGDGFVVARALTNQGAQVKVIFCGDRSKVSGDAAVNLEIISRMGIEVWETAGERDWDRVRIAVAFADCLVDALLGTGFQGAVGAPMDQAVELINGSGKPVVAVDIPSGVDADTGEVRGPAVRADVTVTLALPKPGLLLYPGASYAGRIVIADIGIPFPLLTRKEIRQTAVTPPLVRRSFPARAPDAHKGTCGRVLVVAGSRGMTGAAALCAQAAVRCGAGLVTLGIAESLQPLMAVKLTEVMTRSLPEIPGAGLAEEAALVIDELLAGRDVLAIGPGLGRDPATQEVVREVLRLARRPLVIDADGLNALAGATDLLKDAEVMPVLTPHPGEMAALTGLDIAEVNRDRIGVARDAAEAWGSIVVLKGARTVVAFPDGEVYINLTGNSGMATGGMGDVLTGVIAGLIAQGLTSHEAAVAGVYLHGLSGDLVAARGAIGLTAGDVAAGLPAAIAHLMAGKAASPFVYE